jgi:hypothetical protein
MSSVVFWPLMGALAYVVLVAVAWRILLAQVTKDHDASSRGTQTDAHTEARTLYARATRLRRAHRIGRTIFAR